MITQHTVILFLTFILLGLSIMLTIKSKNEYFNTTVNCLKDANEKCWYLRNTSEWSTCIQNELKKC